MKLAFVTETFPPEINGVAMTFGVIARELGRRGHAVTVYRPRRPGQLPASTPADFTEVALPGLPVPGYPLLRFGLPAGSTLRRRWRTARPDLVHVATEGPLGASAVRAARTLGLPVTSSFHTDFHAHTQHYGYAPPPPARPLVVPPGVQPHRPHLRAHRPALHRACDTRLPRSRPPPPRRRHLAVSPRPPVRRSSPELEGRAREPRRHPRRAHGRGNNEPLLFDCFAALRAANPR